MKFKLSYTLLITTVILGLFSGLGIIGIGESFIEVFISVPSRTTVLTVMTVSIFGGLMKHYKILDKIVENMLLVVSSKKNILMIIPAMIGVLIIPGGALLSAPFIYNIGEDMNLPPVRRAAINLVFRHIAMFILPYSTSILLISASFPDVSIPKLVLLNLFFVIPMVILGYILYLKDIKIEKTKPRKNILKNIYRLIIYTSPIYICVIVNVITGLPFYLTLFVSILIVYLLGDKKDFLKVVVKSFNLNTILTVIAVLAMKEIILKMDNLLLVFSGLLSEGNSMISIMFVFLISAMFFGFITGNIGAALAVLLPMLIQMNVSNEMLYIYLYYCSACAYLGYFFSPLHLCQAFTLQLMNVTNGELYREYRYFAPLLIFILFISVFILKLILV